MLIFARFIHMEFKMKNPLVLRGVPFGRVWGASGVQGFDGEGYWYHRWLWPIGLSFRGMTFVSKTVTLLPTVGNMPLASDGKSPLELKPRAIYVTPKSIWEGTAANKIGLSNRGLEFYLQKGLWRWRKEPWFLSLMCLSPDVEGRLEEWRDICKLIKRYRSEFKGDFGVQKNESCPNVGHDPSTSIDEVERAAEITAHELGVRFVPKYSVTLPPRVAAEISRHPGIHASCISNTIPWAIVPEAERQRLFGTTVSPLENLGKTGSGGGGISGAPLLERLIIWKAEADDYGLEKPTNGCGGILSPSDGLRVARRFDSIAFASMPFLRPWNTQPTINEVNRFYEGGK